VVREYPPEQRIRDLLSTAPQPVPWVPAVPIRWRERGLRWLNTGEDRMSRSLVDPDGQVIVAAGGYVRVGWPDDRHVLLITDSDGQVDVTVCVLDDLEPLLGQADVDRHTFLTAGDPALHLQIPAGTSPGHHAMDLPSRDLGEQFAFVFSGEFDASSRTSAPAWSLWSFDFAARAVTITPQQWVMGPEWDFGYQWPVVAARDQETRLIVAWGFRLGLLVLDETGETLLTTIPD
jgi:hypothetical protein